MPRMIRERKILSGNPIFLDLFILAILLPDWNNLLAVSATVLAIVTYTLGPILYLSVYRPLPSFPSVMPGG